MLGLGRFIHFATHHHPMTTIPDSTVDYITAVLPGSCLHAAFSRLQPLAQAGNPSAMRLMAAMPSPAAPPGGE